MIKNFLDWELLNEKLKIEQEKEYRRIVRSKAIDKRTNDLLDLIRNLPDANSFGQRERVYLPFFPEESYVESEIKDEIAPVLVDNGYELENYRLGLAKDPYKRSVKLGKALIKIGRQDLLNLFKDDPTRKTIKAPKEMLLVFSKSKIDIAGMSTGRGWRSCMNLDDGVNKRYVSCDIQEGSIICYLIKKDDIKIENPTGRVLIKPYINMFFPDDVVYVPDPSEYGTPPKNFKSTVDKIMMEIQPEKTGIYRRALSLYDEKKKDVRKGIIDVSPGKIKGTVNQRTFDALLGKNPPTGKEDIESMLDELIITNYKIHDDLTVDVMDDVDLSNLEMEVIPFKFGTVNGNFDCSLNKLKSLVGSPRVVTGNFNCVVNDITTLEGGPEQVNGKLFSCDNNKLTSLEYLPKFGRQKEIILSCSANQLKSLKGCPAIVSELHCTNGNLESLKGAPSKCLSIDVSFNKITDFDEKIDVSFTFACTDNNPPLTKDKIRQIVKNISADSYQIEIEGNVKTIANRNGILSVAYIEDKDKNASTMIKKFDDWINESLHSGVPVDFFKKIHQYSKKRPLNIQDDITDALVNNDLEDVSHHFYELGTNPPEEQE